MTSSRSVTRPGTLRGISTVFRSPCRAAPGRRLRGQGAGQTYP